MNKLLIVTFLLLFASCHLFEKQPQEDIVARVGDQYLFKSDIQHLVGPGIPKTDSILLVKTFIDKWATQKLLMNKAKINLTQEKQKSYDELVQSYKTDLYTKAYLDIIATQTLNDEISEQELQFYYEQNKDNFYLNEELIQLRYIHVSNDNKSINSIKQQLYRFDDADKKKLKEREIQFKTISLNDSVWVQAQTVKEFIPVVNDNNYEDLLKKSNSLELQDSLGVYLIYINDVLRRNDIAPLSYIKPTIEQIILNRRKLEIIRNLEKDILQDAIKNKNFEVYE